MDIKYTAKSFSMMLEIFSCLETPGRSELFVNLRRFFEKSCKFHAGTTIFGIFYVSSMFLLRRMQEDLLLYRLLDEV